MKDDNEIAFDDMIAGAQITPTKTARRRRAKKKTTTKKVTLSSHDRLLRALEIKDMQWHDDLWEAGSGFGEKDW